MSQTTPCRTCGASLAPDQRYCLACGTRAAAPRLDFLAETERAEAEARNGSAPGAARASSDGGAGTADAPTAVLPALGPDATAPPVVGSSGAGATTPPVPGSSAGAASAPGAATPPVAGSAAVPGALATPSTFVAVPVASAAPSRLDRIGGPMGAAAVVLVALGIGFLAGQAVNDNQPAQQPPVVNIEGERVNGAETPAEELPAAAETNGDAAVPEDEVAPADGDAGATDAGATPAPDDAATPPAGEQPAGDGAAEVVG